MNTLLKLVSHNCHGNSKVLFTSSFHLSLILSLFVCSYFFDLSFNWKAANTLHALYYQHTKRLQYYLLKIAISIVRVGNYQQIPNEIKKSDENENGDNMQYQHLSLLSISLHFCSNRVGLYNISKKKVVNKLWIRWWKIMMKTKTRNIVNNWDSWGYSKIFKAYPVHAKTRL